MLGAFSFTVDPTGKFAYVANETSGNNVFVYTINPSTGALTKVADFAAGSGPYSVTTTQ